jgi:hypothetical protein
MVIKCNLDKKKNIIKKMIVLFLSFFNKLLLKLNNLFLLIANIFCLFFSFKIYY